MLITTLLVSLIAMILIGFPIAIALAGSSMLYIALSGTIPQIAVIHRIVNGVDSFPLLAIPFFVMAGNLMNTAGITERIYDFAKACVGWLHGGLGHVNVLGSVIFSGMSGTATADAGGIGTIEIKAMRDHGYDPLFAVGLTGASSTLGPIIPPSLPLVVYGVTASVSVGQLFIAGILPGLVMAALMMIHVWIYAKWRGYSRDAEFRWKVLWYTAQRAVLPLSMPAIIIGSMTFGILTPTEAAIAACALALLLGVIYRTLTIRGLIRVSYDTIETTAVVLFIVAGASIFGWVLTTTRAAEEFSLALLAVTQDPFWVILAINGILLVVGCFLEPLAAIAIMTPVLLPAAVKIGMDPVHFGIMMVLNLMIGLLTPPVGMVLFVLAKVAKITTEQATKAVAPFYIPLVIALAIVSFVPWVTMVLPTYFYR